MLLLLFVFTKKDTFCEKKCDIVDPEFVKICHEQVLCRGFLLYNVKYCLCVIFMQNLQFFFQLGIFHIAGKEERRK